MYVFTLGSYQYLFKRVNEGAEARRSAFWTSLILTGTVSIIGTLLTYLFPSQIASWFSLENYVAEFKLTVLVTATTAIMTTFLFYHYGLGRNNFQNFLQFLRGSLWVILTIGISVWLKLSLEQIFIVINVAMFFILFISVPWKELTDLLLHPIKQLSFVPLFKYCIPLLPYFAGVWGIPMIIRTQLNIYDGAAKVALFSVAYTLMEIVFMFISTITATLSPHFFAEEKEENKPAVLYNVMLKYSILCVVLIIPFIYITRYDVILLLTSSKYLMAGDYIPLLVIFPMLRVLIIVFEQVYLKEAKTVFLGSIYSIALGLSFLLSVLLIPQYSILGAIYASLCSYLFVFIALYIKQRSSINFKYLNLPAIFALTLIICASIFLLNTMSFHSFIKAIPLGVVMLIGLFLLPIFNEQEKSKLLSLLKIRK